MNLASLVGVVNLAPPIGMVNLGLPAAVVDRTAVNFARTEKREIRERTTYVGQTRLHRGYGLTNPEALLPVPIVARNPPQTTKRPAPDTSSFSNQNKKAEL